MPETLPPSAQRVQDFLAAHGAECHVRTFPESTRTAAEAAAAVGCEVGQIAKSLIFRDAENDRPVLIIASGSNRVDVAKVEAATGVALSRADGRWVKQRVGYAIGGIPPVGHAEKLLTVLDQDLQRYPTIWAAARNALRRVRVDTCRAGGNDTSPMGESD
ncbi:YbaK/EbsC family protein [Acidihalobacter ferrooxydans]|uniref:YbaK/EbsC family protein n=1 Tax=Acidihalobacter ferrooxydans TaxID=1765967 RepID=UPI0018DD562B|nr:YbaK/EbsC family protein [Acidihalobacter ferrooxydans]